MRFLVLTGVALLCGCSLIVGDHGRQPVPSAPSSIELSPEAPRFGDAVTAIPIGSVDPEGTEVHYRFEWLLGGSPMRAEEAQAADTLETELRKGQQWTVRATPISEDGREGQAMERGFTVTNTAPTLQTVGLSVYRPIVTDTVHAFPSGYKDVDGDPPALRYAWRIGERDPIVTPAPTIDLSALESIDTESEQLVLEVTPSDGEDDRVEGVITLGPLELRPDAPLWRGVVPGGFIRLGEAFSGDFVVNDPGHRRVLSRRGDELWEYRIEGGWARLFPAGEAPTSLLLSQTLYDARPDAERLLVVGYDGGTLRLFALELSERGRERWEEIAVPDGGPDLRCFPIIHFDAEHQVLMIYGGRVSSNPVDNCLEVLAEEFEATGEIWLLDLSGNAPRWLPNSGAGGLPPMGQATTVLHPSRENALLLFGGITAQGAAPTRRLDYDLSDLEDVEISIVSVGESLHDGATLVMAVADPEAGLVIGGLGGLLGGGSSETAWVYDPESQELRYKTSGVFGDLDVSQGSSSGWAAWYDDKAIFWPGFGLSLGAFLRFGEVARTGGAGEYAWTMLSVEGRDYAAFPQQVVTDGDPLIVTGATGAEDQSALFYALDRERAMWESYSFSDDPAPLARTGVSGGRAFPSAGSWLFGGLNGDVGGFADMTPWRYQGGAWASLSIDPSPLDERYGHHIFDPGCGDDVPLGFIGGQDSSGSGRNETWLLRCEEGSDCQWELASAAVPQWERAGASYDGHRYVVNVGKYGPFEGLFVTDACNAPEAGWEYLGSTGDPDYGAPSERTSGLIYQPQGETPAFILIEEQAGDLIGWYLVEEGDKEYRWEHIDAGVGVAHSAATLLASKSGQSVLALFDWGGVSELYLGPP